MALPITVPYTFGNATTAIPLSNLDSDYATVYQAVNGIGNGSVALANVTITGGTVSNVSGVVPTPFTANGVVYASSTSALATGSGITYNGTTFSTTNDASINGLTVGRGAGAVSTNTAVGATALTTNSTGATNVAVGYQSGQFNTTGSDNVSIGVNALRSTAITGTGSSNTAIGRDALVSNTTASYNTAVGYQAGYTNTTGGNNSFIGQAAGYNVSTGSDNATLGFGALASGGGSGGAASNNVAIGSSALKYNAANNNTAVGYQAGYNNTTGTLNTFIGRFAGYPCTTGSYNTCLGDEAGYGTYSLTSGSYNTIVGYAVSTGGSTDTYEIVVGSGALIVGKGSGTGFIAPGSTSGTGGGAVYQGNNSAAWSITSDKRLKKNIVDNTVGLSAINQIQVRNFEYRLPEEITELEPANAIAITGVQLGAIAQELKEILPDCVKTESTGVMSVDTTNLTWHMVNAIKELKAEVDSLKSQLNQGA